jgi:hypothetical protein
MWVSSRTAEKVAIDLQLAALFGKWVCGSALTIGRVEPYALGAPIAAMGMAISVPFDFAEKNANVIFVATVTVVALLIANQA